MGWASGSYLLDSVAEAVMPLIPTKEGRKEAARKLIEEFRGADCDTIYECAQEDIAEAWAAMHDDDDDDADD